MLSAGDEYRAQLPDVSADIRFNNVVMMNWQIYLSIVQYWPYAVAVAVLYFFYVNIRISMRKKRAVDEERFIEDSYPEDRIPDILLRYYGKDVEYYNRSIRRWPYKWLWKRLENKFVHIENPMESEAAE